MPTSTSVQIGAGIIFPALRVAGITDRPGRTPAADQSTECIGILNRMMGGWNINPLAIFNTSIDRYALSPMQTTYFIGPTGDFVAPRPTKIKRANIVLTGSSPELHFHMELLSDVQWAAKTLPELPAGAWPSQIYDDYAQPDSKLYLYPYSTVACDLELFTRNSLQRHFVGLTDDVDLPDGYEEAMVLNLAVKIAAQFTTEAHLAPDAGMLAAQSLGRVESSNAPVPRMSSDAAVLGQARRTRGDTNWWRSGGYGDR